jgi:1-deoxy-D-xylulose-5-phosphate reductoisomerase
MGAVTTPRDIVLLGSTGSIGTQAIDVIDRNPDRFRVVGLSAGGGRVDDLARQVVALAPEIVGVAEASVLGDLHDAVAALAAEQRRPAPEPAVVAGADAATQVAAHPCDVVLNGITGSIGLAPTLAALDEGHVLALANKESLVAGGALVRAHARPGQIVPVDSEHSALAQCLRSGSASEIRRLVLTASGGPFRGRVRADLADVTVADALAHPTWDMGPVVTINSATLVNKGLEVIEAHELFDLSYDRIAVVVHPQSIVHSMVEYVDGSTIAQVSPPDMRLPIAVALGWPDRVADAAPAMDWTTAGRWEFLPLDEDAFPAVRLARQAGAAGGLATAIFNAANEEAVAAFLAGRLSFTAIVDTVEQVLADAPVFGNPTAVPDVLQAESWARHRAGELTSAVEADGVLAGAPPGPRRDR